MKGLSANWTRKRLRFVVEVNPRTPISRGLEPGDEVLFLPMEAIGEGIVHNATLRVPLEDASSGYTTFREGDVVVAKITPCFENGKGALIENLATEVGFGTTELHVLRGRPEVNRRFLLYTTQSYGFREGGTAAMFGAGGQKRVPERFVKDFLLEFPSISEQSRIVGYLDHKTAAIDALIAKKERLIEMLQEKRQALITQVVTKGLDPDAPMKDSGVEWLGEIPAHWEMKRLRRIGEAVIGLTFDPSQVTDEGSGVLVLRASNVSGGRIVLGDTVYVNTKIPTKLITRPGDILICSRSGSADLIGKNALISEEVSGVSFGAFMMVFRSSINRYLYFLLNSTLFAFQMGAFQTSTINQLTVATLYNFTVPIPPDGERAAICDHLVQETTKMDRILEASKHSVGLLHEYRQALISAAVTGKIEIPTEEAV